MFSLYIQIPVSPVYTVQICTISDKRRVADCSNYARKLRTIVWIRSQRTLRTKLTAQPVTREMQSPHSPLFMFIIMCADIYVIMYWYLLLVHVIWWHVRVCIVYFQVPSELFASRSIASPTVSPLHLFVVVGDYNLELSDSYHCQLLCVTGCGAATCSWSLYVWGD